MMTPTKAWKVAVCVLLAVAIVGFVDGWLRGWW